MSSKPEIKIPPALRWREFRMRFVPIGVFICAIGMAVHLWQEAVLGPNMVGTVEMVQTSVTSPDAGVVTNLLVRPFQLVKAGDPVASVLVTDARAISIQLQDLRSAVSLSKMEINSILSQERSAFTYESLNLNMLRFRADLSGLKAELPTLEATLKRYEQGWKDQVVPYNDYEDALRQRDSAKARIAELQSLVDSAQERLNQAAHLAGGLTNIPAGANFGDALKKLNADQAHAMETLHAPVILRAPIDGTVGAIMRRAGENVLAGDTILTINAIEGERIIAYVRQGAPMTPKKGMAVNVICRNHNREQGIAKIEDVGHQFETITNHALMRPGIPFETGVPIGVSMPATLRTILRPGEVVDLAVKK